MRQEPHTRTHPGRELMSLVLALLILLAMGVLSYNNWVELQRTTEQFEMSRGVLQAAARLLSTLKDSETGQRGFLLTGQAKYLEPYRQSILDIPVALQALRFAAAKRPDQTARIRAIEPLVEEKLAELRQTVELRQSQGFDAALAVVMSGRGKAVMDEIRVRCTEIETVADNRISQYGEGAQRRTLQLVLIGTIGGGALCVLLILATVTIRRGIRARESLLDQTTRDRDWLQTTLGSIGDAVIATDAKGDVTLLNGVAQALTGWTAEQAIGLPLEQIFAISHEETGALAENPVSKAIREGRIVGLANHTILTAKDGTVIPIEDSAAPIRDRNGKIAGVILVFRDVSERKKSDRAFKESAERLRTVLDANPIGMVYGDIHGQFTESNDAFLSIIGYTREEFASGGIDWKAITPPEYLPGDVERIAETRRTGTCAPYEKEYIRKDGSRVPVYVGYTLLGGTRDESVAFILDLTARKQAERTVRETEERLRLALASADIGTWEMDPVTGELQWDARCKAIFGLGADVQVNYEKLLSYVHPDDRARVNEITQNALNPAGTGEYKADYRALPPNGSTVWIIATGKAYFEGGDGNRRAVRLIGTAVDVTEVKVHEEQLRSMVDSIDQLAWMADADGGIFWYNRRWYEYTGTTADQMRGWGWQAVHDPAILPKVLEEWNKSIRTGVAFDMIFPLKGADGVFRLFLTRINPVRDPDGTIVRWFGTNTDVEVLQRTEAALRASEERFRQLAESMPQALWTATPDGVCDYINPRWTLLTGCDLAATQAGVFRTLMTPADVEALDQAARTALREGSQYSVECRFREADGVFRWYLVRAVPVLNASGEILKWFGTATDIDAQKHTEEELRRANHDLESFAYSASHDLQEPIRNVAIYSELIAKRYHGVLEEEGRQFLGFLTEGGRRLARLINDLLAYTQAGVLEDHVNEVDASEVLKHVLATLSEAIRENAAVVSFDPLPEVGMSEAHLQQLFQNLIGNALKYRTEDSPRIHVSAMDFEGTWRFSIRDNGIGIDLKYQENIFGVFKRLHNDTKYSGTGIGLAICQRVVERYGGRIWVESELGKGATFFFTIPPNAARGRVRAASESAVG
jgi:PAS domain S-box-containing protein